MEIYSDMKFSGNAQELKALLDQLDDVGSVGGWTRDSQSEKDMDGLRSGASTVRCFKSPGSSQLPESRLWLDINPTEWCVTNIVPEGPGPIPPAVYCTLLDSFRTAALPLIARTGIVASEPMCEVGPEHWLSPNALKTLRAFSGLANKSTGVSHPRDRTRWNKFVIAAHRDKCKIGGAELSQILVEDQHWSESKASDLGILFEYEISLLNDLDEHE